MDWETYLLYLTTLAVFFLSPPGPSQILIISNSLRYGHRASVSTMAGDLSANALQMTAAAFGIASVMAASPNALLLVKWGGVVYLIFTGLRRFQAPSPTLTRQTSGTISRKKLYLQGFMTSAANPKAVIFFAALFPQFIDVDKSIWLQLLVLGATYLLVDGSILCMFSGAAERLLGHLRGQSQVLNRISGVLMIAAAGLLALKSVDVMAGQ